MAASNEDRCKDCKKNPGMGFDPSQACEGCEISPKDFTILPQEFELSDGSKMILR